MGNETFKKRQKEAARREKQQKKATRRMERRTERERVGEPLQGENTHIAGIVSGPQPKTYKN
jgi:hypothetical protein